MKKFFLILTVLFCSTIACIAGEYSIAIDGVVYDRPYRGGYHDPYYYVSGYEGSPQDVVIRDNVNGLPVMSIGSGAFSGCKSLHSVVISNYVTEIGSDAFNGCSNLQEISIPNYVTTITYRVFQDCTNLTSITIPGNVNRIDGLAFYRCSKLEKVTFLSSDEILKICNYPNYAFMDCPNLNKIEVDRCIEGFLHNENIFSEIPVKEIVFGSECSIITEREYAGMKHLESVSIPSTIELIMPDAFSDCTNLKNVTIEPDSTPLYMIQGFGNSGIEVFNLNRQLYEGTIEVGSMGTYTCKPSFAGCSGLTSINLGENVKSISDNMFSRCTALKSVTIPSNISRIGEGAFSGCTNLKSINIEDSDETILINSKTNSDGEGSTFASAPLETLYLGRNIEYSGTELSPFKNKTQLTTLTIGNKTTAINNYLFYGCANITMLSVPSSVKTIGNYAFYDCNQSRSLTISKSVESIGEYAFYNCKNLKNLTIPGSVVTIGDYAFRSCSNLTNIKIGEKVEKIGNYAFLDCYSAESISLGKSVKTIGDNAFYNCQAWSKIDIPNSVETIGNDAFALCLGAKELKIGDGVKSLGLRCFTDCEGLNKITIGASVKEIGDMAFFNCENVKEIYVAAPVPPTANESVFSDYTAKLYVPLNSTNAYKEDMDSCWPLFTFIDEYNPALGIEIIMDDKTKSSLVEVYNMNGLRISDSIDNLIPGIYIVRQGNTVKKIVVK